MPEKKNPGTEGLERDWRLKDIQKLMDLVIKRGISEFEMEKGGFRVRIRCGESHPEAYAPPRPAAVVPAPASEASLPASASVAPASASAAPSSGSVPQPEAPSSESTEGLYIIKSPIVGTFYRSPSPNAEPFVQPGDEVKVGQVLCIIEAMKLMNEIESEVNGQVVRVYPEGGQPVEYGQSLFAIKPSRKK